MVETPWGNSASLRERMLAPGTRLSPARVARSQRERLYGAMVASTAERGYAATSVADLVALSGVSRSAFYRHFDNKQACFLATLREILPVANTAVAARMREEDSWEERVRSAVSAFTKLLVAQPAAARLCLVEAYAAGPEAVRLVEDSVAGFEKLAQRAFEEHPERRGMPAEMTRAMIGGLRKVVHTRLHRGTEAELAELMPDLLELGLSYRPPPRPLPGATRRGRGGGGTSAAGRDANSPTLTPRRDEDRAERIIRATMAVVATKGFPATTVADIAEAAGASLSTFYEHFDSKAQVFDAALYSGRAKMLGVVLPAYRRARNWPEAIRAATQASLDFLTSEPEFTHLITVDVYAAGPQALERRDLAIEAMQVTIDGGLEYAPQMKPIAREAIISAIYSMLCDRVQEHGVENLAEIGPLVVYMTLAPFIGAEQASATARRLGSA